MARSYFADIPDFDFRNFKALVDHVAATHPGRIAMRMRFSDREGYDDWSYERLHEAVLHCADFLIRQGLGKGDRVVILSENRPEWCVAYLAMVSAGMVVVPIDSQLHALEIRNICADADARGAFASTAQRSKIESLLGDGNSLQWLVLFDGQKDDRKGVFSFADLLTQPRSVELPSARDIEPTDAASIIFTSGTTGVAKGVVLSHGGVIANINAAIHSLYIDQQDVFMTVLPLYHTYTTTCSFLSPLTVGGSITIAERLVGKSIIANVRETGATVIIAVPILLDKIRASIESRLRELKGMKKLVVTLLRGVSTAAFRAFGARLGPKLFASLRRQAGLDSLRLWVSGGGPLSPTTAEFYEVFGFTVVQGYGMSENGPLISTNTVRRRDNRSVGLPVKYTEVRIAAPDRRGVGEIQVRSPSLMKGYHRNEAATREVMTEDGYLRTGDLGRIDRRGFLFITGRSKNLIVTAGGKNVYPEEIESCFSDSPAIAEILVLGRSAARGDRAEDVVAVCCPDYERIAAAAGSSSGAAGPGTAGLREANAATVPEAQVAALVQAEVDRVNRTLPGYKKIVEVRIRKQPFEQTASGKIKRYLYRSLEKAAGG